MRSTSHAVIYRPTTDDVGCYAYCFRRFYLPLSSAYTRTSNRYDDTDYLTGTMVTAYRTAPFV